MTMVMKLQHVASILLVSAISLFIGTIDAGPTMTCPATYVRKGCYKDLYGARTLPNLLLFGRPEIESKWGNWDMFIQSFVCRCAIESRKKGYRYFGIQFYGECWSGNATSEAEYAVHGLSGDCVGRDLNICRDDSSLCTGTSLTNFVYEVQTPTTKPPAIDCRDVFDKCQQYFDQGLCTDRYPYILRYCPLSCGKC